MAIKPWYKLVTPREDLREGKPIDASEFAVHLDQIREGRATADYQNPEQFFERTYLTQNLTSLAAEVVRRLSGEKTETSAVFNMSTQFGGGKTHSLTLLYHLARHGADANRWHGVSKILERANVSSVPQAATAVFVGTEFDSISGRGGDDGTPKRMTPWGEIAFQLGGEEGFNAVAEHDRQMTAPAGDVIRRFLPKDKPCLILVDELMNYISRSRKSGVGAQFYNFIHNLSEEVRGRNNTVMAVSIPASELEMSVEDQADHERLKKLLDRLGKAVIMSAEGETSEIIRRRLFEWDANTVGADGKVLLPRDAISSCNEYADWVVDHRQQIPGWFPVDHAREAFATTYPFHPMVLSVFERKWQTLPRFQRTRGVLRLLALWVSHAYKEGFTGAHRDALIGLGTAPLEDPLFRAAMLEQLGEPRLEVAITTDICGKPDSHATRMDKEAANGIKKARLHRKVATTIFFESNGGTVRAEATEPEIRLAVAEPDLDIGNIETVLDALSTSCYYMSQERKSYRFSMSPNLNKILADRRATIQPAGIDERVLEEVREVFKKGNKVDRVYFPTKSSQVSDRAALTLVVLAPEYSGQDPKTLQFIKKMTEEYSNSSRTFKSALIWCVAESAAALNDEARKLLAWEAIQDEQSDLRLDDGQKRQLTENLTKSKRDLTETVWRAYKNVVLLGKDNTLRVIDLGLVHSSAADYMVQLVLNRLRQDGDVEEAISPNFIVRNWPPAFTEWSIKSVRDAFFASPQFPRLLSGDVVRETIARGVTGGHLAYVGKTGGGEYKPFFYNDTLTAADVDISEDMFIVKRETAEAYKVAQAAPKPVDVPITAPDDFQLQTQTETSGKARGAQLTAFASDDEDEATTGEAPVESPTKFKWAGEVPWQKWTQFYTKVLSKYASGKGLKLTVSVEVEPEGGASAQKIDETRLALRELGLNDDVKPSS
jgi:hypothetical protein